MITSSLTQVGAVNVLTTPSKPSVALGSCREAYTVTGEAGAIGSKAMPSTSCWPAAIRSAASTCWVTGSSVSAQISEKAAT